MKRSLKTCWPTDKNDLKLYKYLLFPLECTNLGTYFIYSCDPDPEGGCLPPGQQHHSEQRTQRQGAHRVDTHSYTHIYSCYQRHFSEGGSEEACYIVVK